MTFGKVTRNCSLVFALLFALNLANALGQAKVHRDWKVLPAVVQMDTTGDIFAIGDVHGDYGRLVKLLAGTKIIGGIPSSPDKVRWTAGKSVLVFTGDLIDKGPDALGVIALLSTLQIEAPRSGGRVVVNMGNHEAEFLAHPDSDKSKDFLSELKNAGISNAETGKCRGDVGVFLCSMAIATRVNDWFFSHAGNSNGRSIARLNTDLENGIDRDGFATQELADPNSIVLARLGVEGPGGKSWFESGAPKQSADQLLASDAAALRVAHIVEGHAPKEALFPDGAMRQQGQLFQWRGLLFLIDTGMSRTVDYSEGAVLHIQSRNGTVASAVCSNGTTTRLWDSKAKQIVGYAAPCR